ncbi:putative Inhibitor of growth protein 2 [Hypsibius exemplaris]|uniref:Inhibitor of growth protein 2 n=1 Tax=Hypsibius exemplaris TaxID=2072580 RepID=A0A1W0WMV1_HYPEX|nr:putative Inhibitor of growth protein 2 [Hypsibius exemplaris]
MSNCEQKKRRTIFSSLGGMSQPQSKFAKIQPEGPKMASSSSLQQHDAGSNGSNEYGSGSNRDSLAETFVTSFFSAQGEVAKSVQKGMSTFFELDGDQQRDQETADELLAKIRQTRDEAVRNDLFQALDTLLDRMHGEQTRANQAWNIIDDQITATVAETESHWKKAEPFFRIKQKRSDNRAHAAAEFQKVGGKARKILPVVPMKLTPIGGDIVRPSLIPKMKPVMKANAKVELNSRKRSPSESPERVRTRPEKKNKTNGGAIAVRKVERKEEKSSMTAKEKETRKPKPIKKKRVVSQRRIKREESDDNSASDDDSASDSDPPYRGPSSGHDGDKKEVVDPNEPLYCTCRKVSFGQMVGCDYEKCAIEWFHFVCVTLKAKPRGKWYCPACRDGDNSKLCKFKGDG